MKTPDEIAAEIISALPNIAPSDELAERLKHVLRFQERRIAFKSNMLILAALHVEDLMKEHPTVDKEAALRIAANDLLEAAALIVRSFKRRAGEELDCARFALVAYAHADVVLNRDWSGELVDILKDGISVRTELERVHGEAVSLNQVSGS